MKAIFSTYMHLLSQHQSKTILQYQGDECTKKLMTKHKVIHNFDKNITGPFFQKVVQPILKQKKGS